MNGTDRILNDRILKIGDQVQISGEFQDIVIGFFQQKWDLKRCDSRSIQVIHLEGGESVLIHRKFKEIIMILLFQGCLTVGLPYQE